MTHHNVLGSEALMAGFSTNYEGVHGPHMLCKRAPDKSGSTKVWCAAWLKKVRGKKVMKRKRRKLRQKRMYRLW